MNMIGAHQSQIPSPFLSSLARTDFDLSCNRIITLLMANTDMQTPLAIFPTPPHVLLEPTVTYFRPEEVDLCYQAACRGDLDEVKKQAHQLLHEARPLSEPEKPHPAWLYSSLSTSIEKQNVEIVRFLLDENVVGEDFPADVAVYARAFSVLNLFLQYGWDINQPRGRNETPLLR